MVSDIDLSVASLESFMAMVEAISTEEEAARLESAFACPSCA